MIKTKFLFPLSAITLSIFLTASALCAPPNPEDYVLKSGGFVDLPLGAYVEGSTRFGGIQPDYKLDEHPDLVRFLGNVKRAASESDYIGMWQKEWRKFPTPHTQVELQNAKIRFVTSMIQNALPFGNYRAPHYLHILEEHRAQGLDISLGSYLQCASGVCRENALLTHLALKAVDVPNEFVYVHAKRFDHSEDHAFVVIEQNNEKWIVDPYNSSFHGKNFNDLMGTVDLKHPPTRVAGYMQYRVKTEAAIVRINSYPKYWIPKQSCETVF